MSKSKMEDVRSAAKRLGEWLETHKGHLEGADPKETAHRTAEELKQMLIELNAKDQERKADRREKTAAQSTAGHPPAAA